jgi:prefoldin subunit 5
MLSYVSRARERRRYLQILPRYWEGLMSNEQQIDEAIASLEQAMKALRDLGLIRDEEDNG